MPHRLFDPAESDRWRTTELLLHAVPVSEWQDEFSWCASYLAPSSGTLLDHIVVVNYRANVPLPVVLEELARALRHEEDATLLGVIRPR